MQIGRIEAGDALQLFDVEDVSIRSESSIRPRGAAPAASVDVNRGQALRVREHFLGDRQIEAAVVDEADSFIRACSSQNRWAMR